MTTTPARTAPLLTPDDLAELVGVTTKTLRRWREARSRVAAGEDPEALGETGPAWIPLGRQIRYHPARVQHWLASREQGTPSPNRGTPSASRGTPTRGRGGRGGR